MLRSRHTNEAMDELEGYIRLGLTQLVELQPRGNSVVMHDDKRVGPTNRKEVTETIYPWPIHWHMLSPAFSRSTRFILVQCCYIYWPEND